MRFIADTCFISDLERRRPSLVAWMRSVSEQDVFVSVVTLGELCRGISMRRRRDPADADRMQAWLDDEVRKAFAGRILPVTEAVALRLGELSAQRTRPVADALIAATALVHNLAVVTRNVADFADTGVVVVNPWEAP